MTRTPSRTRTRTTRSSEHAAHRPLMHSVHIALWLKVSPCVSFHVIHACAPVCCSLSVSPHPSFYFLILFFFQLYLMSNSAPDEFSIEDPLCNSSLGSMVTLDYVTHLTVKQAHDGTGQLVERNSSSAHTVKEQFAPEENRDIASFNTDNEFNHATNEENIDLNIPGCSETNTWRQRSKFDSEDREPPSATSTSK